MTDDLLAYLLDDLCPERRAEVELRLAAEPAWRRELTRLEECLAATGDPETCADEPPCDLVMRTCGLVERAQDFGALAAAGLPLATLSAAEPACGGSRWSLADYTVAAGVVGMLAMLMLPAMRESRDAARRRVCQDNMRALGTAIFDYTGRHGQSLSPARAGEPLAMLPVDLVGRGGVDAVELARTTTCPDSLTATARFERVTPPKIPTRQELAADNGKSWEELLALTRSTAIQAGYFQKDGRYRCATFTGRGRRPLIADAPVVMPHGVYMMVHGGQGANVLDEQICVKYRVDCFSSPLHDNYYRNDAGAVAAGSDARDVVLIGGDRFPDGQNHFPVGKVVPLGEGQ